MDINPVNVYSLRTINQIFSIFHLTFSKDYSFSGETHNFWEISYVIKGKCGCTSGDKIYICGEGDVVLHAPNLFHNMWVCGDSECELFTMSFDGTGFENNLSSGTYPSTEQEKYSFMQILDEIPAIFGGYCFDEFTHLTSTSTPDNTGYQIVKNHLELICLSLIRRGKAARLTPSLDADSKCYAKITAFLKENLDKNLTVDDICKGVFESPGKVKKVFLRFTGSGVINHFNDMRCERIIDMLSAGISVKYIAEKMGFSSPYYLSYFFKRETGMTAREYLKSIAKTEKSE